MSILVSEGYRYTHVLDLCRLKCLSFVIYSLLKEYGEKFSTTVMNGYVALEIAIGHKLGLFSALKKFNSPVTSQELANSCKLKER